MHGPTAHSGVHQGSTIPCVINRQPHLIKRTRSVSCAPRYSPRPQRPAFWRCWTRTPVHSPACPPWYLGHLCRSARQAGRQAGSHLARMPKGRAGARVHRWASRTQSTAKQQQQAQRGRRSWARAVSARRHAGTQAVRGDDSAELLNDSPELLCVELQHALGLLRLRGSALRRSLGLRLLARVLPAPRPRRMNARARHHRTRQSSSSSSRRALVHRRAARPRARV
jgi:hypothetical protein